MVFSSQTNEDLFRVLPLALSVEKNMPARKKYASAASDKLQLCNKTKKAEIQNIVMLGQFRWGTGYTQKWLGNIGLRVLES